MLSGEPLSEKLNFIEPVIVESACEFQDGGSVEIYLIDAAGNYVTLWFDFGITSLPRGKLSLRDKQQNILYPVAQNSPLQTQLEKHLLEWRPVPLRKPENPNEFQSADYSEGIVRRCLEGLDNLRRLSHWGGSSRVKKRPYISRMPTIRVSK